MSTASIPPSLPQNLQPSLPPSLPPSVELLHVSRIYAEVGVPVKALDDVALTVRPGEFVSLVGPSGSGKSTLLNIIGALDRATSGQVLLGGADITHCDDHELANIRRDQIGFVFQAFNLLPVLTAVENVEFVLQLQGKRKSHERAMAMLERFGIADLAARRPAEMSGGQQQRVAIARALAGDPILLLADEPSANLDTRATENLLALLTDLNATNHVTIITATHDPLVERSARRRISMRDGRIHADESMR
jgi:putative ABC transport system ATP-binding protein